MVKNAARIRSRRSCLLLLAVLKGRGWWETAIAGGHNLCHNWTNVGKDTAAADAKKQGGAMSKSVFMVNVDSELKFTVHVMESGGVHLQLTGGAYDAVLGPGDRFDLVLRPTKPDENQPKPAAQEQETGDANTDEHKAKLRFQWPTLRDAGEDGPLVTYLRKPRKKREEGDV